MLYLQLIFITDVYSITLPRNVYIVFQVVKPVAEYNKQKTALGFTGSGRNIEGCISISSYILQQKAAATEQNGSNCPIHSSCTKYRLCWCETQHCWFASDLNKNCKLSLASLLLYVFITMLVTFT
jgi:hypothetical protein